MKKKRAALPSINEQTAAPVAWNTLPPVILARVRSFCLPSECVSVGIACVAFYPVMLEARYFQVWFEKVRSSRVVHVGSRLVEYCSDMHLLSLIVEDSCDDCHSLLSRKFDRRHQYDLQHRKLWCYQCYFAHHPQRCVKTDARHKYLVSEKELGQLESVSHTTYAHNKSGVDYFLFIEEQVKHLAFAKYGSEAALEAERSRREKASEERAAKKESQAGVLQERRQTQLNDRLSSDAELASGVNMDPLMCSLWVLGKLKKSLDVVLAELKALYFLQQETAGMWTREYIAWANRIVEAGSFDDGVREAWKANRYYWERETVRHWAHAHFDWEAKVVNPEAKQRFDAMTTPLMQKRLKGLAEWMVIKKENEMRKKEKRKRSRRESPVEVEIEQSLETEPFVEINADEEGGRIPDVDEGDISDVEPASVEVIDDDP
jgi:hypothetical protein